MNSFCCCHETDWNFGRKMLVGFISVRLSQI